MKDISKIQDLQLQLIEEASFNAFDGPAVSDSLRQNKFLWEAAVMVSEGSAIDGQVHGDLIFLRDLPRFWNVDTLYIIPKTGKEKVLKALAKTWDADEINYLDKEERVNRLGGGDRPVLRVWWD